MISLDSIDFPAIAANERLADEFRQQCEALARFESTPLLSRAEANTKIRKSKREDFLLASLALAPHNSSGFNVCQQASATCRDVCVAHAGLAKVFPKVDKGRIRKTRFLMTDRIRFLQILIGELHTQSRIAIKKGAQLVCRLNCYSDLPWHKPEYGCVVQLFPEVQFNDYSKFHSRILKHDLPDNWYVCGSWSELARHQAACEQLLFAGHNVAMAFSDENGSAGRGAMQNGLPRRYKIGGHWFEVFDGDKSDLRFLDDGPTRAGYGRICGLRLKAGNTVTRESAIVGGFSVHTG